MSIDMYLDQSDSQATSTATMVQSQLTAYESVEQSLNDFITNSGDQLKGAAYDSLRSYFQEVLLPLAKGGYLISETTERLVKRFPAAYREQVSGVSLKESELIEKINNFNDLIGEAQTQMADLNSEQDLSAANLDIIESLQEEIDVYTSSRDFYQDLLDKLLAFHASSPSIFEELAGLESLMATGLSQTKEAWNAKTGTYQVPENLSWAKGINQKWSERDEVVEKNYQEAVNKVKDGKALTAEDVKAIELYQKKHPGLELDKDVAKAKKAYEVKKGYKTAVKKVKEGQDLTAKDVKAIEAYQKAYPKAKIDQKVIEAKEAYLAYQAALKKAEDGKKLSNKEISNILDYAKKYSKRIPNDVKDTIRKSLGIKNGIGSEGSYGKDVYLQGTNNGWYSTYAIKKGEIVSEEDGIIKVKTHNGTYNGVEVDLDFASINLEGKDWHLNTELETPVPLTDYTANLKGELGVDTNNKLLGVVPIPEVNISVGYGEKGKKSQDWGLKASLDVVNGLVGAYSRQSKIKQIDNNTRSIRTTEAGFKTINGPQAVIGGLLVSTTYYVLQTGDVSGALTTISNQINSMGSLPK